MEEYTLPSLVASDRRTNQTGTRGDPQTNGTNLFLPDRPRLPSFSGFPGPPPPLPQIHWLPSIPDSIKPGLP